MMMKKNFILFLSVWINILMFSTGFCSEKLQVFVSILPQKYFVQQISKDLLDVAVMVKPGASPATYEPRPSQMAALSRASLYFSIGVPFEKAWLKKIARTNPKMKIIHTDKGIHKIPIKEHQHKKETGHHHESLDPHIWLSPILVKKQMAVIFNSLVDADPVNRNTYRKNYDSFVREIELLHDDLKHLFNSAKGTKFMVFHPSWGYFAHAFGLEQVPIESQGKAPKPAQLKKLIRHARKNGINVIFAQPQFSTKSAKLIAREINGRVILADPLAENWQSNLKSVAEQFKEALK